MLRTVADGNRFYRRLKVAFARYVVWFGVVIAE